MTFRILTSTPDTSRAAPTPISDLESLNTASSWNFVASLVSHIDDVPLDLMVEYQFLALMLHNYFQFKKTSLVATVEIADTEVYSAALHCLAVLRANSFAVSEVCDSAVAEACSTVGVLQMQVRQAVYFRVRLSKA
jgi:hypothetical protein